MAGAIWAFRSLHLINSEVISFIAELIIGAIIYLLATIIRGFIMPENMIKKPHLLTLENRSLLTLTGVEDVSGFDEQTIYIRTADMSLVVKGEALHISRLSLDTGDVVIDGQINSLQYLSSTSGSLRSRLFR